MYIVMSIRKIEYNVTTYRETEHWSDETEDEKYTCSGSSSGREKKEDDGKKFQQASKF